MTEMNNLKPVSPEAVEAFKKEQQNIINDAVAVSMKFKEDVEHHGEQAEQLIGTGLMFTAKMLEAILPTGQTVLLDDQLKWAVERLPHDGVQTTQIIKRLNYFSEALSKRIPPRLSEEIIPYIDYMIKRMEEITSSQ